MITDCLQKTLWYFSIFKSAIYLLNNKTICHGIKLWSDSVKSILTIFNQIEQNKKKAK